MTKQFGFEESLKKDPNEGFVTKADLATPHQHAEGAVCAACGDSHGPMFMHSRCHTGSPTWASMEGDILKIECAECHKPVAYFIIDQGPFFKLPIKVEEDVTLLKPDK